MDGSFPHNSSFQEPTTTASTGRSRIAPTISTPAGLLGPPTNFYSHPARISVLNSTGDLALGGSMDARALGIEMEGSEVGSTARVWGNLPSFSRAFSMLVSTQSEIDQQKQPELFVPSYLTGSTYAQKLEEAHRSKLQYRESTRTSANGLAHNLTTFQQPLPSGSHRGLSHTVIERPAPADDDDSLPLLPSKWNKDDLWGGIEIQSDGLVVKYTGSKSQHERDRDYEACAVRTEHFMPAQCGIYYYEVQILSAKRDDATIGIGFSTKAATLSRPIGWEPEAWGYHGDDGRCFTGQNTGRHFGPRYNKDDVIGCGINFRDNTAFFTKNGIKLGTAFNDIAKGKLYYPAISLKKPGECIRANFGQTPFVYNIDDLMQEERKKVHNAIETTDTSTLIPGMNETDVIQALVLQFLQHDGYVETARAFAEDMRVQKESLNLDPNVRVAGINIRDDEDANNRQRIRKAILEGDIDRALKYTNAFYPNVLRDNEHVYFRLRCRRFIEMVRKAAQLNMMNDLKRDTGNESAHQDIDMDMNGSGNPPWSSVDSPNTEVPTELFDLECDMLEYGQTLQAEYANDPRKEVSKALNEIWALVAYRNPLKEPQVQHLLDSKGRVAVAEELNSAILLSLGKSSRASLETLYAQTSVLLEDLRQDGGVGAFVSIDDALQGIP